jgi:membrane-associated protease RseP (regulator of RpoE activity)
MHSKKEYLIHIFLFILTLITTTLAGGEWVYGKSILASDENQLTWEYFLRSTSFSIPFIGALLVHELGHYFTARIHKVRCSLPLFIPVWLGFIGAPSIGTFGALIRLKGFINSRKKFFDIGIAGPLAGFMVGLGVLIYGFLTLPDPDYLLTIHPEYADPSLELTEDVGMVFELGDNLLFWGLENLLADPSKMPNNSELIHYPFLFAGFLILFFTALNLLPIGQLDGGHVIFGLFPHHHKNISLVAFTIFLGYAGIGLISPNLPLLDLLLWMPIYIWFLNFCYSKSNLSQLNRLSIVFSIVAFQYFLAFIRPEWEGYQGWLFFGFLLGRIMGLIHPEVRLVRPLDRNRKFLGWVAILIFCLCFSPKPFAFG